MDLAVQASLIEAAEDLKVVELIIGAIRTADAASAAEKGGAAGIGVLGPAAIYEPRPHLHPEPRFEPRPVRHPTPRIEPRLVHHPVELCLDPIPCPLPPRVSDDCGISPSPIQPPWKVLPWQCPPAPALKVKLVVLRPDNKTNSLSKGSVIDCFI